MSEVPLCRGTKRHLADTHIHTRRHAVQSLGIHGYLAQKKTPISLARQRPTTGS